MLHKGNFFVNFQKQLPKSGLSIGCRKEKAAMPFGCRSIHVTLVPSLVSLFPAGQGLRGLWERNWPIPDQTRALVRPELEAAILFAEHHAQKRMAASGELQRSIHWRQANLLSSSTRERISFCIGRFVAGKLPGNSNCFLK